ncbi:hypothetical protein EDEG_00185 [Edhazardia aedis USNM 41457]|uniref:GDP-mannose transporter n=1 Tax=Edhazardia aedis (strain USNM 41457) TaxID=1003232 RepID=J9DQU9_EDHAE|nr:hypothetical protein EDEG_00185 [Edhazardia aedis USNM 41457]|eukprot:EJW03697.1 hypothetical protein EDEG_00185 [Edhazardia aedis USNM 41457]
MNKSTHAEKVFLVSIYLLSSIATTVINKYVISILKFNMLFVYLMIQSIFIAAILSILHWYRLIYIRRINSSFVFKWAPCSLLLSLMIFTGAKSMEYLPVSLFTLFKNFSIILVACSEYFIYARRIGLRTIISFSLIILSSIVGEYTDFTTSKLGYAWSVLNALSTATYVIMLKFNIDTEYVSNFESVFYTNFLSIPFLLFGSLSIDKIDYRITKFDATLAKILTIIIVSSIFAFFVSYSTAWTLRALSSTTLSMMGAFNKLFVSFSGMIFLGEKNISLLKGASLIIGSLAGLLYSKEIKNE